MIDWQWSMVFSYLLTVVEDKMRFGIAKLETVFPFVSALSFRYL